MRTQLILGFVLVIALVVGTSWALAVRTTDAEFSVLVSDVNRRQARLIAPSVLEEYSSTGNWDEVQESLVQQIAQQEDFIAELAQSVEPSGGPADGRRGGRVVGVRVQGGEIDFSLGFDFSERSIAVIEERFSENFDDERLQAPYMFFSSETDPRFFGRRGEHTVLLDSPGIEWVAGMMIIANQRTLVIDDDNMVVVDTGGDLLGKRASDSLPGGGVELYTIDGQVGSLLITSSDGVYTGEQSSFLHQVRRGFLLSGLASAAIALIIATGLAHQITRPIRSLTNATTHIQAGDWGYQVDFRARNEFGRLADAFNQMSSHLAEQRRLRARLVDDLAHELNTPLSLMRLELEGMADGLQTPAQAAKHLNQELSEVSDLVSDLIFLATADTAPEAQMDWLDINALTANAVRRFEGKASQSQRLSFEPSPELPQVYGDPYLVQRAVSNLISNAIRYTPKGGDIRVMTRHTDSHVEVMVSDSGEGIASEHLPHIFERFYRADESRARHSGGRGLGLAIVKQIMDQHSGDVRVESVPGKGSTFTLMWSSAPKTSG
jgi:signal transduction histidine kinase